MHDLAEILTFTVPLGSKHHFLAQQFSQQQSDRLKAKQVYLNTLAISAVEFYLYCLGIETNWSASSSWNPLWQTLTDVADLEIPTLGKLECSPVLPDTSSIYISPEACLERIGYIAVQFDASLQQATLLGFSRIVPENGELHISQLQSLEDLLLHLYQLRQLRLAKVQVNLGKWLQNLFEAGWQPLEALLGTMQSEHLTLSLRSAPSLSKASARGAKLINLGLQLESQFLVLLVAIASEADRKVSVLVQVHPTQGEIYLPPRIELSLISESGATLQMVQSRSQDNYIQLKRFRGDLGESFDVQVAFGKVSVTENFII